MQVIKSLAAAILLTEVKAGGKSKIPGEEAALSASLHRHEVHPEVKTWRNNGPKTVHVVAHSHDDVGYLKTVEEYFEGARQDIQFTNVKT
jgi:hypothetical protein